MDLYSAPSWGARLWSAQVWITQLLHCKHTVACMGSGSYEYFFVGIDMMCFLVGYCKRRQKPGLGWICQRLAVSLSWIYLGCCRFGFSVPQLSHNVIISHSLKQSIWLRIPLCGTGWQNFPEMTYVSSGTLYWLVSVAQWKNVGLWPAAFLWPALDLQLMGNHLYG